MTLDHRSSQLRILSDDKTLTIVLKAHCKTETLAWNQKDRVCGLDHFYLLCKSSHVTSAEKVEISSWDLTVEEKHASIFPSIQNSSEIPPRGKWFYFFETGGFSL